MSGPAVSQLPPTSIVLASTSAYRAAALQQLALDFITIAPQVDEQTRPGEAASDRALRLAEQKTVAVAAQHPQAVVIGSDQVGSGPGGLLHKPGTASAAVAQLRSLSGARATFHTAVCVYSPLDQVYRSEMDTTTVQLRQLTEQQIKAYVAADQPLNCAGAFKVERLGIALFENIRSDDPSALIGLPLIALSRLLLQAGIDVLNPP